MDGERSGIVLLAALSAIALTMCGPVVGLMLFLFFLSNAIASGDNDDS